MIDQLHLQNLKAWRDSGAVQLAPVTMLLGSNSSGKSTLLQSLLLLKQTVASPDRTIHLNLGGDEANDYFHFGGFDAVLARDAAAPRQFSIALSFDRPEGERVRQGRFACSYGQTASGAFGPCGASAAPTRCMWTTSPARAARARSLRPSAPSRSPPRPWPCWAATARTCRT